MGWFKRVAAAAVLAILVGSAGCGGSSSSSSNTTAPSYTTYTDTFSDGILLQGADINSPDFGPAGSPHRVTIHQASSSFPGSITVTVDTLSPLSTITFGIGLTTWNTTNQSCDLPLQLTTSSGKVGVSVSGQVSAPGDICVALFDVGNVQSSSSYSLTILHN